MEIYVSQLLIFVLLFVRTSSLLTVAPITGSVTVPVQVKVALGLFISLVLFPIASEGKPDIEVALIPLVIMILKEGLVGVTIGFATGLIFSGVRYAGELIGFDIGLSLANMIDPESGMSNPVIAEFLALTMSLVFLLLNGHHFVLRALILSYATVPIGALTFNGPLMEILIRLTGMLFVVAVKIAAPMIVASFLINAAFAVLARVVPQINIFIISFPLKIGVGFFLLSVSAPLMVYTFKELLAQFENNILDMVRVM